MFDQFAGNNHVKISIQTELFCILMFYSVSAFLKNSNVLLKNVNSNYLPTDVA